MFFQLLCNLLLLLAVCSEVDAWKHADVNASAGEKTFRSNCKQFHPSMVECLYELENNYSRQAGRSIRNSTVDHAGFQRKRVVHII